MRRAAIPLETGSVGSKQDLAKKLVKFLKAFLPEFGQRNEYEVVGNNQNKVFTTADTWDTLLSFMEEHGLRKIYPKTMYPKEGKGAICCLDLEQDQIIVTAEDGNIEIIAGLWQK
ncbi:MAG: hypothetical protein HYU64_18030 [Armatimonadetes bacterium]|nr:hypothetical protein [Armatimonadota bacterium]